MVWGYSGIEKINIAHQANIHHQAQAAGHLHRRAGILVPNLDQTTDIPLPLNQKIVRSGLKQLSFYLKK
jgi:hypothetical protein